MSRQEAVDLTSSYFESGRFQADLASLVAYRTESQNANQTEELNRYLVEVIKPRLDKLGFDCSIHENPAPDGRGGPFLIGSRHEAPDFPTILTYGHGDVIWGQEGKWSDGLHPFELFDDGDRLYGRGAADNKAQHLINIAALEAVLKSRTNLGFNLKIIFEMSEEIGSPGLAEIIQSQQEALRADVLIASDGPRLEANCPTLFMGSRGGVSFDLRVDLREGANHSGNWGGLLSDPAIILTQALACICDERGQIRVPEWRPDSLTPEIRAAIAKLPELKSSDPKIDPDWGEKDLTPAERAYGWNSFAILAMTSGVPDAPVNAIAGSARATCQLRFVVGTKMDEIIPGLRRHLDAHGFHKVEIVPHETGLFGATRVNPDHPWVKFVQSSIRETTGQDPHVLPNLAGSLPNDCFADGLGIPTVWIPHSYLGCKQHAPDEHVLKPLCLQALQLMAGLFWDIGSDGGSLLHAR